MIVHSLSRHFSEELGTKIEIGGIDIRYSLEVVLEDVVVCDKKSKPIILSPKLLIALDDISLSDKLIRLDRVLLYKSQIRIVRSADDSLMNFQFIVDYFSKSETERQPTSDSEPWGLQVNDIGLMDCSFAYIDELRDTSGQNLNYNNLFCSGIDLLVSNIFIKDTVVSADIAHLSVEEKSGFNLYSFQAHVDIGSHIIDARNVRIATAESNLDLDFKMEFETIKSFASFVSEVKMTAKIRRSKLNVQDLAFFAPILRGMDAEVFFSGSMKGTVSNLAGRDLTIDIGNETHIFADLDISGLPQMEEAFFDLRLHNSKLSLADLRGLNLPGGKTLQLPSNLQSINNANVSGSFIGFISDFQVDAIAQTDAGFVKAGMHMQGTSPNQSYNGNLIMQEFDLALLTGKSSQLGRVTGVLNFRGSGTSSANYNIAADGNLPDFEYYGYRYRNISLKGKTSPGKFDGELVANDPNAGFSFNGLIDFSESLPKFNFIAFVDVINLNPLGFSRNDSIASFSGIIDFNFVGNHPDNLTGSILLSGFSYIEGVNELYFDDFRLTARDIDSVKRRLEIASDLIDGSIEGDFSFMNASNVFSEFIYAYLPAYVPKSIKNDSVRSVNFEYSFVFKDIQPILNILYPSLQVAKNSQMDGSFDSGRKYLGAEINSDLIQIAGVSFKQLYVDGETFNSNIYITAGCDEMAFTDSLNINDFVLNTVTYNDLTTWSMYWTSRDVAIRNKGNLSGIVKFSDGERAELAFDESSIFFKDTLWNIRKGCGLSIDTQAIIVDKFELYTNTQALIINGTISKDPIDLIEVSFKNINISDIDELAATVGLDPDGTMNGTLSLSNLYGIPEFKSDLRIDQMVINKDPVGNASIISYWDDEKDAIYSKLTLEFVGNKGVAVIPIDASGYFNPRKKEDNLDFKISLNNLNLKLIQPYLRSFSSSIEGLAKGEISIKGSLEKPLLSGSVKFMRTNIKIDYLNTYYSFVDTMTISNNEFALRDVLVNDMIGRNAVGNIVVTHNNFEDFYFDISLEPKNFQFLNTTSKDNELFYGTAFATGLVKIYGPPSMLTFNIIAKTDPGTRLFIPMSDGGEVYQNDFVRFVGSGQLEDTNSVAEIKTETSGIIMDIDLEVTNDAEVQIVFDPKIGDIITGKGEGRIKMGLDESGNFTMFGNYEISEGDYLFTLENVINKYFIVEPGGIIRWTGDPYDADIDIIAKYPLKTSLYELVHELDSSAIYKKRIPVNCILHLTAKLMNPEISFDIELPNSDENTRTMVKGLIKTEEEMNRQVFALLVINSFLQSERNAYSNLGQGVGTTGFEMLSEQFSNLLGQISDDFDLDFTYRRGTEVTPDQIEMALSTTLLNDRIVLDGNVGVGGNQAGSSQQTSNIVGDVNIEYKITPEGKFRIKAFNRSNHVDVVTNNAPYTQGVGIFYRREFDSFRDLWKR